MADSTDDKKDKFNIKHTPYTKGMNFYFSKPLHQRAWSALKEGRFMIGFNDWAEGNLFFYPVYLYHVAKPTFKFNGNLYNYYINKPEAVTSERFIELPIAMDFVNKYKTDSFLEIGNTLNMHIKEDIPRTIVDKYETIDGILNDDIADYNPGRKFRLILSISTMEHVGFDEEPKDDTKLEKSMKNIMSMLEDDGKLLITVPIGYNPAIDRYVKATNLKKVFMVKTSSLNVWEQADEEEAFKHTYNSKYKRDNAIVVLIKE